jgi:hypothetical protein
MVIFDVTKSVGDATERVSCQIDQRRRTAKSRGQRCTSKLQRLICLLMIATIPILCSTIVLEDSRSLIWT